MLKINLVTSNLGKVEEFRNYLDGKAIINHIRHEYRELRSDSLEDIAKDSAKRMAEHFKLPVVVEDSGLFIEALKGFPGTCSSYIHKRIGLNGIFKLMEGIENRKAFYKSAVAYCEPDKEPVSFLGDEEVKISTEIKGSFGFGHDPIVIPNGYEKTYGEMPEFTNIKKFRRDAVEKLYNYLKKNRDLSITHLTN